VARRDVVLDAGPIVAAFNTRDQWHAEALEVWPALIDRCVTTEAVVVEASYLAMRGGATPWGVLEFLLEAGIPVVPLDVPSQRRALSLMRRCEKVPMDYADATLVVVAEALGVTSTFTFDKRGFAAYARLLRIPFVQYPVT
jgi:uncharacterized protein